MVNTVSRLFSGVVLVWALSCQTCMAQINPDRPDQTESAAIVPTKSLQFETGLVMTNDKSNGMVQRTFLLPTQLLRYGCTQQVEFRLQAEHQSLHNGLKTFNGLNDIQLGIKLRVWNKVKSAVSILTHGLLPTGSDGLSEDKLGFSTKLCVAHILTDRLSVGYNLGYLNPGSGRGDGLYSLSWTYGLSSKVTAFAETYGEMTKFETFTISCDTGLTWLAKENLQFDVSLGTGLNTSENFLALGCSWLVGVVQSQ